MIRIANGLLSFFSVQPPCSELKHKVLGVKAKYGKYVDTL